MAIVPNYKTTAANTPTLGTTVTAIAANAARIGWQIQNQATSTMYVLLGTGASTTVFHVALKGGTNQQDGNGAIFSDMSGAVYTGIVTVNGTSILYTALEIAP